ncbi:MAG TPA: hypothetical protein VN666_21710 [Nitrospira sp.]|nr:hypothetical protein [Nitrospira sp.]
MTQETLILEAEPKAKQPRHIVVATRHLLAQRTKAVLALEKAKQEVLELTAALKALGFEEADAKSL